SQLSLLAGMVPLRESPACLRFVRLGSTTADVYLFSDADGDWVMLLDVSREAEQVKLAQQEKYRMQLTLESQPKVSSSESSELDRLNLLIEERNGEFRKALAAVERAADVLRHLVNRGTGGR